MSQQPNHCTRSRKVEGQTEGRPPYRHAWIRHQVSVDGIEHRVPRQPGGDNSQLRLEAHDRKSHEGRHHDRFNQHRVDGTADYGKQHRATRRVILYGHKPDAWRADLARMMSEAIARVGEDYGVPGLLR
jgi:hypothetical protein